MSKSTFTCAPQGAISKGAIAALFVPPEFIPVFDSWLRRELVDQRREKDIVTYFKPGWCAGLTVANVISSGMCGGYIGDRRKKKRGAASKGDEKGKGRGRGGRKRGRGGRKNDGDAAPAAGRGRGRGRGGRGRGRGRGRDYGVPALHDMHLEDGGDPAREEDGASLRRIPEGLADLIDEFGAADESLLKVLNDKIIGGDGDEDGDGEFIALRRRRMLESNLMDGTSLMPRAARAGGGSDDEEDAHADGRRAGDEAADPHQLACWRFKPWFWNVPRHDDAGRKRAKWEGADMEFVTFVADGDGGSENSGGSDSGIPDRVSEHWTREFRMLAAAVPSVWVDARASAGSGSPWSCGLFPCGCTLVVLANVVYSVLKNLALNDAKVRQFLQVLQFCKIPKNCLSADPPSWRIRYRPCRRTPPWPWPWNWHPDRSRATRWDGPGPPTRSPGQRSSS